MRCYLSDVQALPLLSRDQELDLARKLEQNRIEAYRLLGEPPVVRKLSTDESLLAMRDEQFPMGELAPYLENLPGNLDEVRPAPDEVDSTAQPLASGSVGNLADGHESGQDLPAVIDHLVELRGLYRQRQRVTRRLTEAELADGKRASLQRTALELDIRLRAQLDVIASHESLVQRMIDRLQAIVAPARSVTTSKKGGGRPKRGLAKLLETYEQLTRAQRRAQHIKSRFVQSNLRLVVHYVRRCGAPPSAFLDLIQEGNLGLMRAVDRFDYRRGYRFSTYATWWIRQAVTRAKPLQTTAMKIPVHVAELRRRIARARAILEQQLGREPTVREIASELDETLDRVRLCIDAGRRPLSLDKPVGSDDGCPLGDLLPHQDTESSEDSVAREHLSAQTQELFATLTAREAAILSRRFGIGGQLPQTLQQIGNDFGVTRERTRQIEAAALRKLRAPAARRRLESAWH